MCAYSYLEYIGWCLVNISLMNFLLNMVEMMSFITFPALSDCTSYMHQVADGNIHISFQIYIEVSESESMPGKLAKEYLFD